MPAARPSVRDRLAPVLDPVRHHLPVVVMVAVSTAIVVGVAVLPMQTWLEQREQLSETEAELQRTIGEVDRLQTQLDQLQTDEEIERLARENFDLVKPGEESYRILPHAED